MFITRRTDAVTELRRGVPRDVGLDSVPVVLVVADALAVRADGQELLQGPHFGQGPPQLGDEALALIFGRLARRIGATSSRSQPG